MPSVDQFVIAHHKSNTTRELKERLNSSAGSLRMYAHMAGVSYPGHLERVPFWDEADRHIQQGLSAQEIAKQTQSSRQHIQKYVVESGQKKVHAHSKSQRSALLTELSHEMSAYRLTHMSPLARTILETSRAAPSQAILIADSVHKGYSPKEISEQTNHPAPTISGWLVHAGIRERAFTPRPQSRKEAYNRLPQTGLSAYDAAELLEVTVNAVNGYAQRNSMALTARERPHRWQRMQALSVPELSHTEVAYVFGLSETDALQAKDPSWSDTLTHDLQILFNDTCINKPFVSHAYIQEWLSQ